jgi:exodeoxyribonuclease VII large subunit
MAVPETEQIQRVPTTSELARRITGALSTIGHGWVEGEVRQIKSSRGHVYLSLTDGESDLECVIWQSWAHRAGELPKEGALVQVHYRRVALFHSRVNLHVDRIRETGEGELRRRAREALERLTRDGLTNPARRPPLPRYPRRIGLICGKDSNAQADVVKAVIERFPAARIVCCPAAVQGKYTVPQVIGAIARLCATDEVDVILLARGGGSVADLHPFSDERLCRAIAASPVPVVTSIGHTKDRPICDAVAAGSADVPAKACALFLPSRSDLVRDLDDSRAAMARAQDRCVRRREQFDRTAARLTCEWAMHHVRGRLDGTAANLHRQAVTFTAGMRAVLDEAAGARRRAAARMPSPHQLDAHAARLDAAWRLASERAGAHRASAARCLEAIFRAARSVHHRAQAGLEHQVAVLDARDYRRRGYALVRGADGRAVGAAGQIAPGERIEIGFADGVAAAEVREITLREEDEG